ncbi:DUF602-domain-containing protein [Meredithblackwellia eburnea MCA 4105]
MGNDGGSIPKRDDLVKTKRVTAKADKNSTTRQLWAYCALSKQPLRAPIVSCALGKLYNKEALIAHLLAPSPSDSPYGTDGALVAGHLRSLKDVQTLSLTPNPNASTAEDEDVDHFLFICPLSLRVMNGSTKFVYRKPCGCVLSESSLKEMRKGGAGDQACPVKGELDGPEEFITLNPSGEEFEKVKEAWEAKKVKEKEDKKLKKKRKVESNGDDGGTEKRSKKDKEAHTTTANGDSSAKPSIGPAGASVPKLSATLAAKLAEQKKSLSPAIASLYAPKDDGTNKDKDGRSNWMTRGAFTRYA